ncbi:MAG: hypothetical protein KDC28_15385 [Saprospiraceae bacterium]|nr:hypothetical protein [Saprospiraceae bacterium]MCB9318281.1 hypothetical protein [Lewinellaceae bacterium]
MTFFKRNNLALGLLLGVCLPVALYGILLTIYDFMEDHDLLANVSFSPTFRTRTLALVAICSNLLLMRLFSKNYAPDSMRGVVLATFLLVVAWVVRFASVLFG